MKPLTLLFLCLTAQLPAWQAGDGHTSSLLLPAGVLNMENETEQLRRTVARLRCQVADLEATNTDLRAMSIGLGIGILGVLISLIL